MALHSIMWGNQYVDDFLTYALPALMGRGNIPALTCQVHYLLYVEEAQAQRVAEHPLIDAMRGLGVGVELQPIPSPPEGESKYRYWTRYCRVALDRARELDAGLVSAQPDTFHSDGCLSAVESYMRDGWRAVYVLGFHCCRPDILATLDSHRTDAGTIEIGAEAASAAIVRGFDSEYDRWVPYHLSASPVTSTSFLWRLSDDGYVFHGRLLHPLMIWPKVGVHADFGTVDERLVDVAGIDLGEVMVVQDSRILIHGSFGYQQRARPAPLFEGGFDAFRHHYIHYGIFEPHPSRFSAFLAHHPIFLNLAPEVAAVEYRAKLRDVEDFVRALLLCAGLSPVTLYWAAETEAEQQAIEHYVSGRHLFRWRTRAIRNVSVLLASRARRDKAAWLLKRLGIEAAFLNAAFLRLRLGIAAGISNALRRYRAHRADQLRKRLHRAQLKPQELEGLLSQTLKGRPLSPKDFRKGLKRGRK